MTDRKAIRILEEPGRGGGVKTAALVLFILVLGGCLGEEVAQEPLSTPPTTTQPPIYERPSTNTRSPATTGAPSSPAATIAHTTVPPTTLPPTTQPPTTTPPPRVFMKDAVLQRTILNTVLGTDLVYDTFANRTIFTLEENDIVSMERHEYQDQSAWRISISKGGHFWYIYVSRDGTTILTTMRVVSFQ